MSDTTKAITFRRSWPFFTIEEHEETAADHLKMLLVMLFAVGAAAFGPIPVIWGLLPAFIAGDAFNNWLSARGEGQ